MNLQVVANKETYFKMIILGIETSCDESAVALIDSCHKKILIQRLHSQVKEHEKYGGIVPEVAARSHLHYLPRLTQTAFKDINFSVNDIDAIGVTAGPGLSGGLLVGSAFAKGLALQYKKPLWPINHLEAHALVIRLFQEISFPFLILLMSGGHCQLILAHSLGKYEILGQTLDDAIGECFDKVGRILGLGYPAGPFIEKMAIDGDCEAFPFSVPLQRMSGCDFSFSGLKTACAQRIQKQKTEFTEQQKKDFCASFQDCAAKHLCQRTKRGIEYSRKIYGTQISTCILAGGVAANRYLYGCLSQAISELNFQVLTPPPEYCTDNAVMIAWAVYEYIQKEIPSRKDFPIYPRWPLDELFRD